MYFTISFFTHRNTPIFAFLLPEAPHGIVIFWANGGSWTRDLILTKDALYHWATSATRTICSLLLEKYERINKNRAENGAQTRDPQLGRLVLYRLSYFRELTTTSATVSFVGADGFEPPKVKTSRFTVCPIWPLWNTPNTYFKVQLFLSLLSDSNQRPRDYKSRALANWAKEAGFYYFLPRPLSRRRKSGAKVLHFFELTKCFAKKMHFFCIFHKKAGQKPRIISKNKLFLSVFEFF